MQTIIRETIQEREQIKEEIKKQIDFGRLELKKDPKQRREEQQKQVKSFL